MAVSSTFAFTCDTRETLTAGVDGADNPVIYHNGFNVTGVIDSTTTPDAEGIVSKTLAMTAGAYTIDLSSMTGTNGAAVNMTGKAIRIFRIENAGAAAMTIAKGASNGHTGLGATFQAAIPIGGAIQFYLKSGGVAVSGTDKTLDIAGTGTDSFNLTIVYG